MKKDGLKTEAKVTKEAEPITENTDSVTKEPDLITEKSVPKKKEKAVPHLQVYAGPTIPKVVAHGTIYNNGLPKQLADEIQKCPAIASLIVEPERLSAARNASHVKDSPENICCRMVADYIAKKGE